MRGGAFSQNESSLRHTKSLCAICPKKPKGQNPASLAGTRVAKGPKRPLILPSHEVAGRAAEEKSEAIQTGQPGGNPQSTDSICPSHGPDFGHSQGCSRAIK